MTRSPKQAVENRSNTQVTQGARKDCEEPPCNVDLGDVFPESFQIRLPQGEQKNGYADDGGKPEPFSGHPRYQCASPRLGPVFRTQGFRCMDTSVGMHQTIAKRTFNEKWLERGRRCAQGEGAFPPLRFFQGAGHCGTGS